MNIYYKDKNVKLIHGDCLEVMDKLIDKGIKFDAIITDPPYGTTDCSWDSIIPFDKMWCKIERLIKEDTAILLFGNEPFSSLLRTSNLKLYKYDWKWDKIQGANFLNVKYQPLKNIEDIMVFSLGRITNGKRTPIKYNPQGFTKKIEDKVNTSDYDGTYGSSSVKKGKQFKTTGTGYPKCVIQFPKDKDKLHPTQKPVALLQYLINTYTNENELILDFTCGSSSTLIAAQNTNRKCIGIEKEEKYCELSKKRLEENLNYIKSST